MKTYYCNKLIRLVIACLVSAVLLGGCGGAEKREQKYLKRAQDHFAEENIEKAQVEIKNVLQINPKNAEARVLSGKIAEKQGRLKRAFANYNAAIEENPDLAEAHVLIGKIYMRAKQEDNAMKHIQTALSLDPKHLSARAMEAALEASSENYDVAQGLAEKILDEHPGDPETVAVLAAIYYKKDSPEAALKQLDQGLGIEPKSVKLKLLKIKILSSLERQEEAESLYEELIEENPEKLNFYYLLAGNYERGGKLDQAEKTLRRATEVDPDDKDPIFKLVEFTSRKMGSDKTEETLKEFIGKKPSIYEFKETLAQLYLALGRQDEAEALLKGVISDNEKSSDSLNARNDLAKIRLAEQKIPEAKKYLNEIFEIEPNNSEALILNARIKLAESKITDGIADLRAALKLDSQSTEALNLLAKAHERNNAPDLALDNYARVVQLNENDMTALLGLSRLYLQKGNEIKAEQALKHAVSIEPLNSDAVNLLTRILVGKEDWDTSLKITQNLINSGNDELKAKALVLQAGVYRRQNLWEEATPRYEEALKLAPTAFEPLAGVLDSYLVRKKYDDAIKVIEDHAKAYPNLAFTKNLKAHVNLASGEKQKAISLYKEMLEESPGVENNYQKLASIYISDGDYDSAEKVYIKGLAHNKSFTGLRVLLGNVYERLNNYAKSKDQYELALKYDPNLTVAKNNLAIILVNHFPTEENLEAALKLTADFDASQRPTYLDTLGWVHYHLGNYPQAISYIQSAIELQTNPEFQYHLGAAYLKNGQPIQAKEALQSATENQLETNWFKSAKDLLVSL